MSTNITKEHQFNFNALGSNNKYNNFVLFSCFVNGEPASAIAVVNENGDETIITPVFVSITAGMVLTDHDGREIDEIS